MEVILITDFNGVVHGTFNDKKTGCNINLQKPENASKYRRGTKMKNLKEITCEKCSMKIAKALIKADKKDMDKWLKEEKQREKAGLGDEGMVQLSEIEQKPVSKRQPEIQEPVNQPDFSAQSVPQANENLMKFAINAAKEEPAPQSSGNDDFLAQFAVESPKKEEPVPQTSSNDDFLAQFAVNVPKEEPVPQTSSNDDFLAQFAVEVPKEEPVPQTSGNDDFLAQFAVEVPKEEPVPQTSSNDDFLSQFAVSPSSPEPQSSAHTALHAEGMASLGGTSAIPSNDDIMSMFAISGGSNHEPEQNEQYEEDEDYGFQKTPYYDQIIKEEEKEPSSEWDKIASQLFGTPQQSKPVSQPQYQEPEYVQNEYTEPVYSHTDYNEPETVPTPQPLEMDEISLPVLDDIAPARENVRPPILDDIEPIQTQHSVPVLDDIEPVQTQHSVPVLDEIEPIQTQPSAPVLDDIEPVQTQPSVPVLDDIEPVQTQHSVPVLDEIEPIQTQDSEPVLDEIESVSDDIEPEEEPYEEFSDDYQQEEPEQQPVKPAVTHTVIIQQRTSKGKSVKQATPVKKATTVQNAVHQQEQEMIQQPLQQNIQPQPQPQISAMQSQPMPNMSGMQMPNMQNMNQNMSQPQIMNMPQITGYDQNGQPMYTYVQMRVTGYDQNGQPTLEPYNPPQMQSPYGMPMQNQYGMPMQNQYGMPMQNQYGMPMQNQYGMPMQNQYGMPMQSTMPNTMPNNIMGQNLTVGQRIAAAQGVSVQQLEANAQAQKNKMTVGQKIAAEAAAKGAPSTANVSKIATNPHSKDTTQAFKSAISQSKEHANESLTDTQGLQAGTPIISSIEDMLSQLGDNSEKEKAAKRAELNKNIPVVDEFKAPSKTAQKSAPKSSVQKEPERPLTAKEIREKKKQERIDAKFRKDMEKRK